MAVPREALPEPDKYRGGCSQSTTGLSMESSMEELEKGLEELRGFAVLWREQLARPPRAPKNGPPTKDPCIAPVAFVAEDGLVGHQCKKRPLVL